MNEVRLAVLMRLFIVVKILMVFIKILLKRMFETLFIKEISSFLTDLTVNVKLNSKLWGLTSLHFFIFF